MRGCQQFVPPEEWQFGPMPLARRAVLESVVFDVIVTRVVSEATLVSAQVEIAHDRAAPENTLRVAFRFAVTADTGDLLHNGRDGLRAQHWVSPNSASALPETSWINLATVFQDQSHVA